MIEQLVNFVIRPPRADYSVHRDLLESNIVLNGRKYERRDLEVTNSRGHVLQCSHYLPSPMSEETPLPCVIYCHGNSGCRADANEAAVILLPSNITVFTLDFSGSGHSEGDYVSLGWNEMDDLKAVVGYLRTEKHVSRIGLWGRSMGAVTSLMYGAQDPSIAGMVLDSPFSNLSDLMMELVDVYKIRLPKFTVKMAVQYMRREIRKKAQFDIMDLDTVKVASNSFIPALFGHATDDLFIQPHHSDAIFKAYAGDKNIIKFEGDHNSPRPPFYYDSITIFFYNVLRPPENPVSESSNDDLYDMDTLDLHEDIDEQVYLEIMGAMHPSHSRGGASSLPVRKSPGTESIEEALSQTRSRWQMSRTDVPADLADQPDDTCDLLKRGVLDKDACEGSASTSNFENLNNKYQSLPREDKHGNQQRSVDAEHQLMRQTEQEYGLHPPMNGFSKPWPQYLGDDVPNSSNDVNSFARFPSNSDDEERMIMEAIAASLYEAETRIASSNDDAETEANTNLHLNMDSKVETIATVLASAKEEDQKLLEPESSNSGGSTPTNPLDSNPAQRWRSLFGALGKNRRSNSR